MLPACLLTSEPVILRNVPNIGDVRVTIDILKQLGAIVEWLDSSSLRVQAKDIGTTTVDPTLAQKIRASIVLAGPMLARCGRIELAIPGGDSIGPFPAGIALVNGGWIPM